MSLAKRPQASALYSLPLPGPCGHPALPSLLSSNLLSFFHLSVPLSICPTPAVPLIQLDPWDLPI